MNALFSSASCLRKTLDDTEEARCVMHPALAARTGAALSIFAALWVIVSTPALAQEVTINLFGEVEGECRVQEGMSAPALIDFGMLSDIAIGQQTPEVLHNLSIVCNDPDGGTMTVESLNRGNLLREGSSGGEANSVGYSVSASGSAAIGFAPTNLHDPIHRSFPGSADLLTSRIVTLRFRANGVSAPLLAGNGSKSTTVYAGVYNDIVSVSITAN